MLSCVKPLASPSSNGYFSSPVSQGNSVENTPRSSAVVSPTVNLTREYTLAVQTNSFVEIRRTFDQSSSFDHTVDIEHVDSFETPQLLEQFLQPSCASVQEALAPIKPSSLTSLISDYFKHSEHTFHLCLLLYKSIKRARLLYNSLHNLIDDLPFDFESEMYSLSDTQCKMAFDAFLEFDRFENPFHPLESHNFDDMRECFSQLRQQLDHHLRKSQSRVRFIRHCSVGSAFCLIATTVGVIISAVTIATHALAAVVACPICPAILHCNLAKNEMIHLAQVDAAAKGAYVLHKDLDTIDRLVACLHGAHENDKFLIRMGLERGIDRYPIQEILKQLRKNRSSFVQQLGVLEDHIFLCLLAVNRARSLLLQEILVHESPK